MKLVWIVLLALLGGNALGQSMEVLGRVVDGRGVAVANALVTVRAVTRGTGTRYGQTDDVEGGAKTDAVGNFRIHGDNPFISVTVTVEAAGFAKGVFSQLTAGADRHELKMGEGISVIGTVVKSGEPVSGVRLGISDTERGSQIFLLNLTADTDAKGRFRFANVPAKRDYFLYGVMESLAERGAIKSRRISAGTNGVALDVGKLEIEMAFTVEGSVRPSQAGVSVVLGRDGPRDFQKVETDGEGRFSFRGVPAEVVSLAAAIPGQRLSMNNGSLFPINPTQLLGRVYTNVTGLVLEFEPGETLEPFNVNPFALREESLRGVEHSQAVPDGITVSGRVLDLVTSEPLKSFWLMEGRGKSPREWFLNRVQEHSNGVFTVHFANRLDPAVLQFSADDYLPEIHSQILASETNLTIYLRHGPNAHGRILRPDGTAAKAHVVLAGTNTAIHLQGLPLELAPFRDATRQMMTDREGYFVFSPLEQDSYLAAFDDSGFAQLGVEELQKSRDIKLQPWARVEGKLMIGTNVGAGEIVYLTSMALPFEWYPREIPPVSVSLRTRTDTNGYFVFERAPPMVMELAHSPYIRDQAPEPIDRTQTRRMELKPGQSATMDLGGQGRVVLGKVVVEGFKGRIQWKSPNVWAETAPDKATPRQAALSLFLEKLQTIGQTTNAAAREKAEADYQVERKKVAEASRAYFATEKGKASWMASRRFAVQFGEDGAFWIDDLPAGKYIIHWLLSKEPEGDAPAPVMGFASPVVASEMEITVTEGNGPFDLGTVKLQALPSKR